MIHPSPFFPVILLLLNDDEFLEGKGRGWIFPPGALEAMVAGVKFAIRSLCTVRTDGDCGALENQVGKNLA